MTQKHRPGLESCGVATDWPLAVPGLIPRPPYNLHPLKSGLSHTQSLKIKHIYSSTHLGTNSSLAWHKVAGPPTHLRRVEHLMFCCRNVSVFPVKVCLGTGGIIPFKSRVVQALKKKKKDKGPWGDTPFLGWGMGRTDRWQETRFCDWLTWVWV